MGQLRSHRPLRKSSRGGRSVGPPLGDGGPFSFESSLCAGFKLILTEFVTQLGQALRFRDKRENGKRKVREKRDINTEVSNLRSLTNAHTDRVALLDSRVETLEDEETI